MSLANDPIQFKITHRIDGLNILPPRDFNGQEAFEPGPLVESKPALYRNAHPSVLMQKAIANQQAELGPHGELMILTGSHTGRAADDKYVVHTEATNKTVWWANNIKPMGEEAFDHLYVEVLTYLHQQPELFMCDRSIGKSKHFALNIEFTSELPSAALFAQYIFKNEQSSLNDTFKVLHAPFFELDPFKYGTRSDTVIVTSFEKKCVIIVGTQYAGEIKKSMFSVMNYLATEKGILPMHAGANQTESGESFAFFGLSGTGKTTLSTDEGTYLIGDDEHGLSDKGLFNFEGGCYAKTLGLNRNHEPGIYEASTRFGSYLENVKMNHETHEIDFFDSTLTENGRSCYPLDFIKPRILSGEGQVPKNIFFLCADAFGILPPVSRLSLQQAADHFILGYTAKVAGTEVGVKAPRATFSPCFGAPFMLRSPMEYAKLFAEYVKKYQIQVWLINTGWHGGAFGTGERFPIKVTRKIVRAIQNHELDDADFCEEPFFGFKIPLKVRDLNIQTLNPMRSWPTPEEYKTAATALKKSFEDQLGKFRH
jgi:phosphoenolpyruvate carboxykinase (ATP)